MSPILLVDLSSILHPIWHASTTDPNPDATSRDTLARVHALAMGRDHVAICCDSRKSWRRELDPTYKANRDSSGREPLYHQARIVVESLRADGFPVWEVDGFEADDLIASAVNVALGGGPHSSGAGDTYDVEIVSSDKDLLALAGPRVTVRSAVSGNVMDEAAVKAKFGVESTQIVDYLCIVGDASDNVKGVKGCGPVGAVALLGQYKTLAAVYDAIDAGEAPNIPPARLKALQDFRAQWPTTRRLILMRDDVVIPFHEVFRDRHQAATPTTDAEPVDDLRDVFTDESEAPVQTAMSPELAAEMTALMEPEPAAAAPTNQPIVQPPAQAAASTNGNGHAQQQAAKPAGVAVTEIDGAAEFARLTAMPTQREFNMQLEPNGPRDAMTMANVLYKSRLYTKYGSAEGIFAAILRGREMGFPAGVSVDAYHVIDGKMTMDATAIRALVMKSGKVKYFRCVERTDEAATFEAQRGDDPPIQIRYTVADARKGWSKPADAFDKSGWGRIPADMCVARASSKLARLVAPDVTLGLYAPEEFE